MKLNATLFIESEKISDGVIDILSLNKFDEEWYTIGSLLDIVFSYGHIKFPEGKYRICASNFERKGIYTEDISDPDNSITFDQEEVLTFETLYFNYSDNEQVKVKKGTTLEFSFPTESWSFISDKECNEFGISDFEVKVILP